MNLNMKMKLRVSPSKCYNIVEKITVLKIYLSIHLEKCAHLLHLSQNVSSLLMRNSGNTSSTGVLSEICEISKKISFYRTPPVLASEFCDGYK